MTQTFVRYTPEVERPEPLFDEHLHTILDTTVRYIEASVQAEGIGQAVRDAHAKGYGLARAEVEILAGTPSEYAQGIYATPGRHEAVVRFSNGSPHSAADALLGTALGMGLKLFGIEGPTLLEDEPDSGTFDYALINHPVFFSNTVEHYLLIQPIFLRPRPAPSSQGSADLARARLHQTLYDFLTGCGKLPPERWAWEPLFVLLGARGKPIVNLLLNTYWTMGAVRHGDYLAKVRVAPTPASAAGVVRRTLDPASGEEVFRPALVAELREHLAEFDIQVQLCVDLARMPVEEPSELWSEALSPFVTVARLRLPQQDIGGEDNLALQDATSITPWRCTEAHRPLGNIMRARKEVYRQSSILRHRLNGQVRQEPRNLEELFGVAGRR
ncbi:MAG TPA: catalase family protein [Ktedonobacterales bacterium]|jgi:hypothetical protein